MSSITGIITIYHTISSAVSTLFVQMAHQCSSELVYHWCGWWLSCNRHKWLFHSPDLRRLGLCYVWTVETVYLFMAPVNHSGDEFYSGMTGFVIRMLMPWVLVWPCPWWRHQMKTFFALLAICAGNPPVTGEFPARRPVTRNFDVFFDLCLNERLSKLSWGWWFETPSRPLWRHIMTSATMVLTGESLSSVRKDFISHLSVPFHKDFSPSGELVENRKLADEL